MNKKIKIGIIVVAVVAIGIIGFFIFGNPDRTPVGIDEGITNEQGKDGTTSLDYYIFLNQVIHKNLLN